MKNIFLFTIPMLFLFSAEAQLSGDFKSIPFGIHATIQSNVLKEQRELNIYLPDEYEKNDTVKYNVIYLLDGGADEDFFHIASLVRYENQPWIDLFPGSIVVGIKNVNRRRDFTFYVDNLDFLKKLGWDSSYFPEYGGSEKFIKFIKEELKPAINQKFRTSGNNTLIGESLGGLLASEIALTQPDMFSNYIIVSPSLWWGNEKLLSLHKFSPSHPVQIFIGVPQRNENEMMYAEAVELHALLLKQKPEDCKVFFEYFPKEKHATILHPAVYKAFRELYKK